MATCDTIVSGVVSITATSGVVSITAPDSTLFSVYKASDILLDEEGNPILDELSCSIQEE